MMTKVSLWQLLFDWRLFEIVQKINRQFHMLYIVIQEIDARFFHSRWRDVIWQSAAVCTCLPVWYGYRLLSGGDTNVASSTSQQIYCYPWRYNEVLLVIDDAVFATR